MAYKKKPFTWYRGTKPMFVDRELLTSKAYLSLKTPACFIIYGIFLTKRQVENIGKRHDPNWVITNNGSITFTYKEAREIYGLSEYKFEKAIANLVDVGLIDIARPGEYKQPTLYSISDRWELYGSKNFVKKEMPKRTNESGFQKGNKYGRNCTSRERENYHQQIRAQKAGPLRAEIKQLKREKLVVLTDTSRKRSAKTVAVIDARIDHYARLLHKLQRT
ncbi:hypothetical protein ACFL1G_10395 [Planctomycetota bacterium]